MWYVYVMEYYLTMERNGVLIHATVCMNLANIVSEINKSKRNIYFVILFL